MVLGEDAGAVGREVRRRREVGERAAWFVGSDKALARAMGDEMLGGVDDLVVLGPAGAGASEGSDRSD